MQARTRLLALAASICASAACRVAWSGDLALLSSVVTSISPLSAGAQSKVPAIRAQGALSASAATVATSHPPLASPRLQSGWEEYSVASPLAINLSRARGAGRSLALTADALLAQK